MQSLLRALSIGNAKLFAFYFKHLLRQFSSLPRELVDEQALQAKVAKGVAFEIHVDGGREFVENYAEDMEKLSEELDSLAGVTVQPMLKQAFFWCIRLACIACAFCAPFWAMFLTSLLQFIFLPYSLFVALCYGLETMFVLYSGHALVMPLLTLLLDQLLPVWCNPKFTVTSASLLLFLGVDQLLCTLCLFKTAKGTTTPMATSRILQSVFYGFLNCKTYYLVLLPSIFGFEIAILPWIVDAVFGLSARISGFTGRFWNVLFYHAHRMAHIKQVYPDAHKFHHFLHDCTAFDAHIFGSGAPEEWLILMCDLLFPLILGCIPASLSYHVLTVSWCNKWVFHTRADKSDFHSDNFHADHHALHRVNFGTSYPLEMFMKTTPPKIADHLEWFGCTVRRKEVDSNGTGAVCLQFIPIADSPKHVIVKRGNSGRLLVHQDSSEIL
eukprot:TRINITY_DN80436_c0_g1_i1.p1 TRINITY_DN80436_c0_g1~~TRINITY_DN80436_c0_g1_i1.p1  ORF type:complete len:440 (+),score=48.20 TRINITY_DN80436_c0_g1_i1:37-1356(+)